MTRTGALGFLAGLLGFLTLVACALALYAALGLRSEAKAIRTAALRNCRAVNNAIVESNRRIVGHNLESENLVALADALTHTRTVERAAAEFVLRQSTLGKRYIVTLRDLETAYAVATQRDAVVARVERRIHFTYLPRSSCRLS